MSSRGWLDLSLPIAHTRLLCHLNLPSKIDYVRGLLTAGYEKALWQKLSEMVKLGPETVSRMNVLPVAKRLPERNSAPP
jgi:hypothetical protein